MFKIHRRYKTLALSSLILFTFYFVYDTPAALNKHLNLGTKEYCTNQITLLYSIYAFPNMIIPIFFGLHIKKRTQHIVTLLCVLVFVGHFIFTAGVMYSSFSLMLVGRFVFGIGGESFTVIQNMIVAEEFEGKELAFSMSLSNSVARLGTVFNYLVVPISAVYIGKVFSCIIGCFLTFFSVFFCVIMMRLNRKYAINNSGKNVNNNLKDFEVNFVSKKSSNINFTNISNSNTTNLSNNGNIINVDNIKHKNRFVIIENTNNTSTKYDIFKNTGPNKHKTHIYKNKHTKSDDKRQNKDKKGFNILSFMFRNKKQKEKEEKKSEIQNEETMKPRIIEEKPKIFQKYTDDWHDPYGIITGNENKSCLNPLFSSSGYDYLLTSTENSESIWASDDQSHFMGERPFTICENIYENTFDNSKIGKNVIDVNYNTNISKNIAEYSDSSHFEDNNTEENLETVENVYSSDIIDNIEDKSLLERVLDSKDKILRMNDVVIVDDCCNSKKCDKSGRCQEINIPEDEKNANNCDKFKNEKITDSYNKKI
ncbi:hypothetical protein EDEG_03025 [Edhazardia aedis USNM 41457]|uniref:Lysosomal dipeptide transporter MFSD1 n=1 Tax=Edhazardia aedis (strain USNM 41457) TaxID=1003232 RepID=J9DJ09_EDHAE|nr:hypothetical protein EDEG_03025 [Edhazardia aedis USNM 41457]|eukprot:EJW02570.1 hypothetical protein EDEG_03025 [Edhazardia aedis USNM 41457]